MQACFTIQDVEAVADVLLTVPMKVSVLCDKQTNVLFHKCSMINQEKNVRELERPVPTLFTLGERKG